MNVDAAIACACELVPGLVRCALVLLPEGLLLGGAGDDATLLDLEPLIRSAGRCLAVRTAPALGGRPPEPFVEYMFVIPDQLVVVQAGRRDARLALVVVCTKEVNLAFVRGVTRSAIRSIEATVDLSAWGL